MIYINSNDLSKKVNQQGQNSYAHQFIKNTVPIGNLNTAIYEYNHTDTDLPDLSTYQDSRSLTDITKQADLISNQTNNVLNALEMAKPYMSTDYYNQTKQIFDKSAVGIQDYKNALQQAKKVYGQFSTKDDYDFAVKLSGADYDGLVELRREINREMEQKQQKDKNADVSKENERIATINYAIENSLTTDFINKRINEINNSSVEKQNAQSEKDYVAKVRNSGLDVLPGNMSTFTAHKNLSIYDALSENSLTPFDENQDIEKSKDQYGNDVYNVRVFASDENQYIYYTLNQQQYDALKGYFDLQDQNDKAIDDLNNEKELLESYRDDVALREETQGYLNQKDFDEYTKNDEELQKALKKIEESSEDSILTGDEAKAYVYLNNKYGEEKANEYLGHIPTNKRQSEITQRQFYEFGQEHPIVGSAMSVILSPARVITFLGNTKNAIFGTNDYYGGATDLVSGARAGVESTIDSEFLKQLYSAGMSLGDMVAAGLLTGGSGTALVLAGGAAGTQSQNLLNKGASNWQAVVGGAVSGAFEYAFEKISIGSLLKNVGKVGKVATTSGKVRQAITAFVKESGVNWSEETATEVANSLYDILANGDYSDYNQSVLEYQKQGYTKEEAENMAVNDMKQNIIDAGISGLLMGQMAVAGGTVFHAAKYAGQSYSIGKQVMDQGLTDNTLSVAREFKELSKNADEVETAIENGKSKTAISKLGRLYLSTVESVQTQAYDSIKTAASAEMKRLGVSQDKITKAVNILNKAENGEKLTSKDISLVQGTAGVQQVFTDIALGESDQQTAKWYTDATKRAKQLAQKLDTPSSKKSEYSARELLDMYYEDNKIKQENKQLVSQLSEMGLSETQAKSTADIIQHYRETGTVTPKESNYLAQTEASRNAFNQIVGTNSITGYVQPQEQETPTFKNVPVNKDADSKFEEPNLNSQSDVSFIDSVANEMNGVPINELAAKKVQDVANKLGLSIAWDIKGDPKEVGYAYIKGNVIHMNPKIKDPIFTVFKHEFVHYLENTGKYQAFADYVKTTDVFKNWIRKVGKNKNYSDALKAYRGGIEKIYKGSGKELSYAEIDKEMIANFVGENLFGGKDSRSSEALLKALANEKWYDVIKRWFRRVIARLGRRSPEAREILKLEDMFTRMYQESKKDGYQHEGTQHLFAGENSKTANKSALQNAKKMLENGVDSETIRQETGWYKGYDGKWRFEIDDFESHLIESPKLERRTDDGETYFIGKVADILDHKELFMAYPELKNINIIIQSTNPGVEGIYQPKSNYITLNIEQFKRHTKEYNDYLNGGRKSEIEAIEKSPEYKEYHKFYDDPKYENIDPEKWLEIEKAARDKFFSSELGKRYYALNWGNNGFIGQKIEFGWDKSAKAVLMHELQHAVQNIESLASGADINNPEYERVAGEIEARDVEKRLNYNSEQRKNTRPDIDRNDVVFADNEQISYSIEQDNDGNPVVVVNTDQGLFGGVDKREYTQIARKYLNEKFKNQTLPLSEYNLIHVQKVGIDKYLYSGKNVKNKRDRNIHDLKMKASTELDNLLETSEYVGHEEDTKNHSFAEYGFDYYKTIFIVDGQIFEGIFDVAVSEKGSMFYGMTNIKRVTSDVGKYSNLLLGYTSGLNRRGNSNNKIAQKPSAVKNNIRKNQKNNTSQYYIPVDLEKISYDNLRKMVQDGEMTKDELWEAFNQKSGSFDKGAKPRRDIDVPQKVSEKTNVRRAVRTILEDKDVPDEYVEIIKDKVLDDKLSYTIATNEQAEKYATKMLEQGEAQKIWSEVVSGGRKVTKNNIAVGEMLLKSAVDAKDAKEMLRYAAEVSEVGTRLGQAVQAFSLLKKMGGIGELLYIQKAVDTMNRDLEKKYKNNAPQIQIDENLAERLASAKNTEDSDFAKEEIMKNIGEQVPSTFLDKWNAWRYMAMLLNPRTHLRNFKGNAIFLPFVKIKNAFAYAIERALPDSIINESQYTKSLTVDKKYKDFAREDFENDDVQNALTGGGKMNPTKELEKYKRVFKNNALEKARKFNFDALEKEDSVFLKMHYIRALGEVLHARKIDLDNITQEQLFSAREYAIQEAKKATYRDASDFANLLNRLSNSNKAANVIVEGLLPFKKTPINVVKRGMEYSPVGLVKTLSKGMYDLKKGKINISEFCDGLASGLTGTGIMAVGMLLQALGVISVGFGGDDEDWFKQLNGEQEYSIQIFGKSYTIDWAAPACIPFFIGAELQKALNEDNENFVSAFTNCMTSAFEPIINLSMLQGINDTLNSIKYSDDPFGDTLIDLIQSYFMQALPTLGGQIARTIDGTRRANYIDKNSPVPEVIQSLWNAITSKVPGLSYTKQPYVDEWGREEKDGNIITRLFLNMISPGYYSDITYDATNREIQRVYDQTGENKVFPSKPDKYIKVDGETKYLTAEEYTELSKKQGEYANNILSQAIEKDAYKNMSDLDKADFISKVYSYSKAKSKYDVLGYEIPENSEMAKYAAFDEAGADMGDAFIGGLVQSSEQADTNNDGTITKDEKIEAIRNSDIKDDFTKELWEYFLKYRSKNKYKNKTIDEIVEDMAKNIKSIRRQSNGRNL